MTGQQNGLLGLSTTAAARYLGVSLGTIRRWTIRDLEAFAATLRNHSQRA